MTTIDKSRTDALTDRIKAMFAPNPVGELGPSDEPESQYRFGYNTALEDVLSAIATSPVEQPAAAPINAPPNALWTRHGSGSSEWWSFKGYEARKDSADQWVLRKGGEELYRHTFLQVVMAHAERAILAAMQADASQSRGAQ
ncbi:hypothetical protein WL48_30685 [Burkholderia ubonensis]|uniref:hypothetical protein n=1 Tax=Burkholderia ubonensis TaxID=101571 RepID=UPI0007582FB0|nr:hypothetical protein [Burkholderia ubonensis]KVW30752.1 hypothetical protein WK93_07875 [Burkholderia ubonensis]KWC24837.1 hypothetical protein WL48_30685 [Burkholderia ubonensis]KWC35191.1 hypothetical protein WL49_02490 [Burkholderia ubonensis]